MSSSPIELCGVSRSYGKGIAALNALDLCIREGERLAVLGPSGSGKTTLLRLIAGLEEPDAGTIKIGGRETRGVPPHRRDVAMVFQNPALYPHLSVEQNLAFGLKARKVGRRDRLAKAGEIAELLGLSRLLKRRPDALSGGERQRVALGRAMARRPAVLLLDEPFSNLDDPLRASLRGELLALHRRFGSTMIHVTHDQGEAMSLGDRVAVLHEGRLMQVDSPARLYGQPAHRFVATFVGSPGMNFIDVEVVRKENELRISTPHGNVWTGGLAPGQGDDDLLPLRQPRPLEMGVRPEAVVIAREVTSEVDHRPARFLRLPADVARLEYQGGFLLATLEAGGRTLVSRVGAPCELREGQHVEVRIEPVRASWFNPTTGGRLELHCQPHPDAIA